MDQAFAFEDFDERIELQITARHNQVLVAALSGRTVFIPLRFVIACAREGITDGLFNAHKRGWVATLLD